MWMVLAGLTWFLREPVCSRFWHSDTRELGNHRPPETLPFRLDL